MRILSLLPIPVVCVAVACGGERQASYPAAVALEDEDANTWPTSGEAEALGEEIEPVSGFDDATFVAMAASSGQFEVESSQAILASDPDGPVAAFAKRLVDEHRGANEELARIADDQDIAIPATMSPQHLALMGQIEAAPADERAAIYLGIQRQAHQETIALFERCASECEDADLRAYAERTLPVLRAHLDHADRIVPGGP